MFYLFGLLVVVGLIAYPVSRAVHRELARTDYALSTVVATIAVVVLFVVAGFIFLSKFRFER